MPIIFLPVCTGSPLHTGVLYCLFGAAFWIALLPLLPFGKIHPFRNRYMALSNTLIQRYISVRIIQNAVFAVSYVNHCIDFEDCFRPREQLVLRYDLIAAHNHFMQQILICGRRDTRNNHFPHWKWKYHDFLFEFEPRSAFSTVGFSVKSPCQNLCSSQ